MPVLFPEQKVEPCCTPFCGKPATHFVRVENIEYHLCKPCGEKMIRGLTKPFFMGPIGWEPKGYERV